MGEARGHKKLMSTLIRNGTVVTASETKQADILIEDGRIREVRPGIPGTSGAKVIDAFAKYVIPGGIDAHTHLDMPLGDDDLFRLDGRFTQRERCLCGVVNHVNSICSGGIANDPRKDLV